MTAGKPQLVKDYGPIASCLCCGTTTKYAIRLPGKPKSYLFSLCVECLGELLRVLDIDKDINP